MGKNLDDFKSLHAPAPDTEFLRERIKEDRKSVV